MSALIETKLCDLLKISSQSRTTAEIRRIVHLTENLNYFRKLSYHLHYKACKVMKILKLQKGDILFTNGEKSNAFYVLFSGSISYFINKSQEILKNEEDFSIHIHEKRQIDDSPRKNSKLITAAKLVGFLSRKSSSPNVSVKKTAINNIKLSDKLKLEDVKDFNKFIENGKIIILFQSEAKAGDGIGQMSDKTTRNCTAICNETCELGVFEKNDYKEILMENEKLKIQKEFDLLMKSCFKEISKEKLMNFRYLFVKKKFLKGHHIFKQDEGAIECYLIKKGEIELYSMIDDDKITNSQNFLKKSSKKQKIRISILSIGEFFGEIELISGKLREMNAVCISQKVSVFTINGHRFLNYIKENKHLHSLIQNKINSTKYWFETQKGKILKEKKQSFISNLNNKQNHFKFKSLRLSVNDIQEIISNFDNTKTVETPINIINITDKKIKPIKALKKFINPFQSQIEKTSKNNFSGKITEIVTNNEKALKLLLKSDTIPQFQRFFEAERENQKQSLHLKRRNSVNLIQSKPETAKNIKSNLLSHRPESALLNKKSIFEKKRPMSATFTHIDSYPINIHIDKRRNSEKISGSNKLKGNSKRLNYLLSGKRNMSIQDSLAQKNLTNLLKITSFCNYKSRKLSDVDFKNEYFKNIS